MTRQNLYKILTVRKDIPNRCYDKKITKRKVSHMKKQKVISIFLILLFVITLTSSCSNRTSEEDEDFLNITGKSDEELYKDLEQVKHPALPEGMKYQDRTYYRWDGSWAFSNIDYMYGNTNFSGNEGYDPVKFLEDYTRYPPHGAFYPDYKSLGSAPDSRATAFRDFERRLEKGQITDASEIDSFIAKLEELGSENLVKEVQNQLSTGENITSRINF